MACRRINNGGEYAAPSSGWRVCWNDDEGSINRECKVGREEERENSQDEGEKG